MNKAQVRKLMVGDKLIYFPMGDKVISKAQVVYMQEIITDVRETFVVGARGAILVRVCDREAQIDILVDGFTVNANSLMPFVPKFWDRVQAVNREAALLRQLAADYLTGTKIEMPLVPKGRILPSVAAEKIPYDPFRISRVGRRVLSEESP